MFRVIIGVSMIGLFLLAGSGEAEGTNWLYLIDNGKGDKCYIDMDSIERTSPDTMRIVRKIEPDSPQEVASLVSYLEVDCQGSRIKSIKETTHYRNGEITTTQGTKEYHPVGSDDIEESLVEFVCGLKRARQGGE